MKFNNGYWLLRDGISGSYATETVDVRLTEDDISAAALTKPWLHRGSHLNTSTITVDLRSPRPDVVTVRVSHLQRPVLGPSFDVADEHPDVTITSADGRASIESGDLTASITTHGEWSLRFETAGGEVTSAGLRDAAFMRVAESTGERSYMVQRLALPVGAHVYGLGERFTAFVKNGQVVESWNEDGGTASEQSYKAIPLLVTDAGFGVFVDSPGRVSFEIGSEVVSALQFSVPGEEVVFHVIQGTPEEILEHYTAMTGRPALPPKWSLGLWLTTSFTTDYDEATVTHFVDGMVDRGIPLSVFHFDTYWMRPLNWCDFTWDEDSFPDPEGMLRRLSERGLRTSVWINPYLGQRSPLFREAAEAGYLLRRADGSVWQWDMWVAGMGIVDFTNPAAREWYSQKVRGLLRQGVSAIKADFGERIPTDVVWSDGSDPESMHNYYSYLYNKTVFDAVVAERGANEAVLFARSATAGGQQFPVHWGGDSEATYASMAESLRGGLSLGLSGFGFWSHDIGGFERTPTAALFKRWLLFGYFSSHARLHGSDSYRVPWAFDEEAVDVARDFGRLRNELAPYLWNAAVEAHEHGVPMMRAMVLAFPDDPACASLDLQYMLGRDLLVAPVFSDEGTVRFYVPAGRWIGLLDGEERIGPAWMRETHGFDSLPLLVRAGTVVPRSSSPERPDVDYAERPVFEVFGLDDGAEATASLRDDAGEVVCTVTVARAGELLTARLDGDVPSEWTLRWAAVGQARPVEAVAQGEEALELRIG